MGYQYYQSILGLRPLTVKEMVQGEGRQSPFTLIITSSWIPLTAAMREDIASALALHHKEICKADEHAEKILNGDDRYPRLQLLHIMAPYVWHDIFN
jgi:hypothetical protein